MQSCFAGVQQPASLHSRRLAAKMSASALDGVAYCAVAALAAANGTSASLPLTVGLIGLIVWQTARDVQKRMFGTGLALAGGLSLSLVITIPGIVAGSVLDRAQLLLPAAILVALFVYAISFASIKASEQARATSIEHSASIFIFPFLWATSWAIFCRAHSLGRLISWTPLREFGPFYAMASAFGLPGLDFLIALMAVAVVELLGGLRYAPRETTPLIDYGPNERTHLLPASHASTSLSLRNGRSRFRCILILTFFLAWWGIAGIVRSNVISKPNHLGGIKIACILPQTTNRRGRSTLSDYILESEIVSGRGAKMLQWPEAAVQLATIPDKVEFAAHIKSLASRRKAFIGTSYTFQDDDDAERSSILSSMFGPQQEIVYTYAKQALVPIAETYRFVPGHNRLPRKSIFVPEPRQTNRAIPRGQNITISTAICHDTSFDHIVRQAHTSSLVLVPSSVYSERVAWSRINQLRANARALSTSFLVCDGNKEGISAFIDPSGDIRYWQKGSGSFDIKVPLTFKTRTAYGAYGDAGSIGVLLACLLACAGLEVLVRLGFGRLYRWFEQAREALWHRFAAHYNPGRAADHEVDEDLL